MNSWIPPDQSIWIFAVLIISAAIGIVGEQQKWFGKISGAIVTITFCAILTSVGIIPSASDPNISVEAYQFVYNYIIPISIPLLLFSTQIGKIIRYSGKLLILFMVGSLGVVLGALLAANLVPLGPSTHKIAGVFTGTYTGGSVNFMSVAASFDFVQDPLFATAVVVDNTFTNLYFIFIFSLTGLSWLYRLFNADPNLESYQPNALDHSPNTAKHPMSIMVSGLTIAVICAALGKLLATPIANGLNTDINLEILLITLFATVVTNLFPSYFSKIESTAFDLGMILMFVFLATIGAACDLAALIQSSGAMILFALIILMVHLVITLVAGVLLKMSLKEVIIASLANVGGPSISAPVAAGYGLKQLVTPAILIAILGYVIGTLLGIGVGIVLQ